MQKTLLEGWVEGWKDGRESRLRIAYSNQKDFDNFEKQKKVESTQTKEVQLINQENGTKETNFLLFTKFKGESLLLNLKILFLKIEILKV